MNPCEPFGIIYSQLFSENRIRNRILDWTKAAKRCYPETLCTERAARRIALATHRDYYLGGSYDTDRLSWTLNTSPATR